jgi:hypothetical protein
MKSEVEANRWGTNMGTILIWTFVALGPSLAALAWFMWHSDGLEGPGRDQLEAES